MAYVTKGKAFDFLNDPEPSDKAKSLAQSIWGGIHYTNADNIALCLEGYAQEANADLQSQLDAIKVAWQDLNELDMGDHYVIHDDKFERLSKAIDPVAYARDNQEYEGKAMSETNEAFKQWLDASNVLVEMGHTRRYILEQVIILSEGKPKWVELWQSALVAWKDEPYSDVDREAMVEGGLSKRG